MWLTVVGFVFLWISGFVIGAVVLHFGIDAPIYDAVIKSWTEERKSYTEQLVWYNEQLTKAEQKGYSGFQKKKEVDTRGSTGTSNPWVNTGPRYRE